MALVTTFNPFGLDNPGWKSYSSNLTDNIVRIYYGNNKYFAQTESKIYYSLDGKNWAQCAVPSDVYTGGTLLWCGDKYVHVGRGGDYSSINYGIYSYDGITWMKFNFPESNYFNTFIYGNGIYIATISAFDLFTTNDYFYSTNGINWTKYELPEQHGKSKIAFKNGVFVIITNPNWNVGTSCYFFSSTDGINWSLGLSINFTTYADAIITTNNKFYVFFEEEYYTSTDGNSWVSYSYNGYNNDFFSGGRWLILKKDGDYTWNNYTTFRINYEDIEGKPKYIKNGYKFVQPIYNPNINKYFTIAINEPVVAFY